MTVTVQTARDVSAGNGSATAFPTSFKFFAASDLVVTLVDTTTLVETVQTIVTDYTVAGGGSPVPATGTVTFLTAPPSGTNVVVQRTLPFTQSVDYQANDPFPADVNEGALDRLTFLAQQNADDLNRVPLLPLDFTGTQPRLPTPVDNEVLVGNAAATGWEGKTAAQFGVQTFPLAISAGGTNAATAVAGFNNLSPLTTKGDLLTRDASNNIRVPVGIDGQILEARASETAGFRWVAAIRNPSKGTESTIRTNAQNIQDTIVLSDHETTFTVDTGADTLDVSTNDGFVNGDIVRFQTTVSDLPAPLATNTDYYIINATASTIQLATTFGGSAIDITDAGTGTHTIYQPINGFTAGPIVVESSGDVTIRNGSNWRITP